MLYDDIKAAGIPHSNHQSDLYFPVTPESTAILRLSPVEYTNARTFTSQIDGGRWYDVPFAFLPWWDAKR